MIKICKYCGKEKSDNDFRIKHLLRCRECERAYQKEYWDKHRKYSNNLCGIYKIQSLKYPDKIYIGSSKDIETRWRLHKNMDRLAHRNYKLFFHIKKYGIKDLSFYILKICNLEHLVYWEQYYISELNPFFNLNKFASEPDSKSNEARKFAFGDKEMDNRYFNKELQLLNFLSEFKEELISINI